MFKFNKQRLLLFFLTFSILYISAFAYKTNEDFPYYHFNYTMLLVEKPSMLGVGLFNHGFRTPSSLFYINSGVYTLSSILILINAHYIKVHAEERKINLKDIKSLKIYDQVLFYSLLGNILYTTSKSILSNTFTIKKIYSLIISFILFGSLWINYNFLY
jgi:hypothetical protein